MSDIPVGGPGTPLGAEHIASHQATKDHLVDHQARITQVETAGGPPGPTGPTGPASTVPGPTGPTGPSPTVGPWQPAIHPEYGQGNSSIEVRLINNGTSVEMRGSYDRAAGFAPGALTAIDGVPPDCIPSTLRFFPLVGANTTTGPEVLFGGGMSTDGTIFVTNLSTTANQYVWFDSITYSL